MSSVETHAERIMRIAEILAEDDPSIAMPKALEIIHGGALYLRKQFGAKIAAQEMYRQADALALQVPSRFDWSKAR
jgi:hypothetical protein